MAYKETQSDITARIKEQADIVQIIGECIDLKRSGARFLGLCPFHGEKTPSFSVHAGQQFFHCFGCGESGDVFSFMMKYYHMDFPSAVKELAEKYHIELPEYRYSKEDQLREKKKDLFFSINEKSTAIYEDYLEESAGGGAARNYLEKRGVGLEILKKFRIGYAPSVEVEGWNFLAGKFNALEQKTAVDAGLLVKKEKGGTYDRFRDRIVFPIMDISGRVCGFGGRIVGEGQPKYLNSPESMVFNKSRLLLGLYQQKDAIRREKMAILVEGNFDLISLVANGCENVVAPLGTALTKEHLRLVKRFAEGATLLFDGDSAGAKAAVRSVPFFLAEQLPGRVALLPKDHDPDTFVREKGVTELDRLLDESETLPEFVLARLIQQYGMTLDGKSRIVEELRPLVKAAVSPLQRSLFVSHFAQELGMEVGQLDSLLDRPSENIPASEVNSIEQKPSEQVIPLTAAQKQLVEFMVLQPRGFAHLERAGVREFLEGGMGEILFLQYRDLMEKNPEVEPEELLSVLPDGSERDFVAELLLNAMNRSRNDKDEHFENELADLLDFLKRFHLQQSSKELLKRMDLAQKAGDNAKFQQLMMQNVEIVQKLQGEDV